MNDAIILNNNAVLSLQMGNAFEACNMLMEASSLYLQMTDGAAQSSQHRRMKHRDHQIHWIDLSKSFETPSQCEDSHPRLYNFALAISKPCCSSKHEGSFPTDAEGMSCSECTDDSCVCPCSLSPVIWYNLGLSCHIMGKELSVSTQDGLFYLRRSNYLYKQLLNEISTTSGQPESKGVSTLFMAVLNNLACLYYEMGSPEDCVRTMRKLQGALASTGHRPTRCYQRDWGVFFTNLMMLECSGPNTAGAA
jgi:hypothetical protein